MFLPVESNFIVPAKTASLSIISEKVSDFFGQVGWDEKGTALYNVQLALSEICTNIIVHAYSGHANGKIEINFKATFKPPQLQIETRDQGKDFDVSTIPQPDLDVVQEHGYGLFLANELMDELVYETKKGQNIWRLSLYM
jgi:serine/threonine-protein kinase RsbW